MNNSVAITLSHQSADDAWASQTLYTQKGDAITIHIPEADNALQRIQRAARQLSASGLVQPQLTGTLWGLEEQWSFAQGYYSPKLREAPVWCDEDPELIQELQNRFIAADWVRNTMNTTPEDLSPERLVTESVHFLRSASEDITYEYVVGDELLKQGFVGTYHVGRGSERPPAALVLDYKPGGAEDSAIEVALVGKGITFDSGGYSIKTSEGMLAMKHDMGGAAYQVGALWLAIKRGLTKRVRLYLCCAENLISGHAYKLGDVLHYPNGTTVEVVNTDAEGRLVMADGLHKATEAKIPLIIDAATLTGAAHVAVGNEYNALFTMNNQLAQQALDAAEQENEGLWRLPLEPFHRNKCPSPYADTANSVATKGGGAGGASNAAGFLSRFVTEDAQNWIHLDLAGAFYGKDSGAFAAGGSAMGVRTIANLIQRG